LASLRARRNEIVVVVPLKAERTTVQGAGFSPEAVPGNSAKRRTPRIIIHFFLASARNADLLERGVGSQFVRMSDLHTNEGLWGEKMHRRIDNALRTRGWLGGATPHQTGSDDSGKIP
jgi:hypothetical protein